MAKQAFINGTWTGQSVDRALQDARQIMSANETWGDYNDIAMKRAYEAANRRLQQLQQAVQAA